MGHYLIRKGPGTSKEAINKCAAAMNEFYTFLRQNQAISNETFEYIKNLFKEEKPNWLKAYNNYWRNIEEEYW